MQRSRSAWSGHLLRTLGGLLLIGVLAILPDLTPPRADGGSEVVSAFRGRIESIEAPPQDGAGGPAIPRARVLALEGPHAGETLDAFLAGPGGSQTVAEYRPGEEVVVTITDSPGGAQPFVAVSDRWRLPWLQILGLVFAAAVVLVGGWHGVRALVSLGLTIAVILKILLPLVIGGVPPVPLAVVAASGVTVVTIVLTEGWKRSSLAAILGTTASLAITGLLAAAATALMGFTYSAGSDLAFLQTQGGQGLDLRGVLLAAFILGAVGVLDDVTVTQATLVSELADTGAVRGRPLFASAMRIGRSHIAATVNTLFLAYVGAGLPLLVVLLVSRQPGALVLNSEVVATEIVRTVVGSLGIIAAVPLTTSIAASLATGARTANGWDRPSTQQALAVILAGGAVVSLLVATAVLPLTGGSRPPLSEDVFDPGASFSAQPEGSPPAPADEPALVALGEPAQVVLDGVSVGSVTVLDWSREPARPPSLDDPVTATVRYDAAAPFALDAGAWEVLLEDGTSIALTPRDDPAALDQTLAPGQSVEVTLEGHLPGDTPDPLLIYVDRATSLIVLAVVVEP